MRKHYLQSNTSEIMTFTDSGQRADTFVIPSRPQPEVSLDHLDSPAVYKQPTPSEIQGLYLARVAVEDAYPATVERPLINPTVEHIKRATVAFYESSEQEVFERLAADQQTRTKSRHSLDVELSIRQALKQEQGVNAGMIFGFQAKEVWSFYHDRIQRETTHDARARTVDEWVWSKRRIGQTKAYFTQHYIIEPPKNALEQYFVRKYDGLNSMVLDDQELEHLALAVDMAINRIQRTVHGKNRA